MEKVAKTEADGTYIREAIDYLTKNTESLKLQLLGRRVLVGIVRSFLQSPEIVQSVRGQSDKDDRSRTNFFDGTSIENPLRFIEAHTSTRPTRTKSLWMLARLAFDTSDPTPLRIKGIHE
jgi:hypothetical protein